MKSLSNIALADIKHRLSKTATQKRVPLSVRYPALKPVILAIRQSYRASKDGLNRHIARKKLVERLPYRIYQHSSLLTRKLGDSDPRLQINKIKNLELASNAISHIVIQPGETFSLWSLVGKPSRNKGYVDGMLLSKGKVIEGLGGGLCQLANLLHWMFLHAPMKIEERYHHSLDVFPDSGRTVPFGSGATILYNFIDLKAKNVSKHPLQIILWLDETKLWGEIVTDTPGVTGYKVQETDHVFVHHNNTWHRYNRLWRVAKGHNNELKSELAVTNFAPVLYQVNKDELRDKGYTILEI